MAKFKTGDVVRLKSTSSSIVKMTVRCYKNEMANYSHANVDPGLVICHWFNINSMPQEREFHEDELILVE